MAPITTNPTHPAPATRPTSAASRLGPAPAGPGADRPPLAHTSNGDLATQLRDRPKLLVTHRLLDGEHTATVPCTRLGVLENAPPAARRVSVEWLTGPHVVLVAVTPTSRRAMAALPHMLDHLRTLPKELTVAVPDSLAAHVGPDVALVAAVGDVPRKRAAPVPSPRAGAGVVAAASTAGAGAGAPRLQQAAQPAQSQAQTHDSAQRRWIAAAEVDLVICLGGDGLIFHVLSKLFPTVVPPVVPFNLGSMGFLTPFDFCDHERQIRSILHERKVVTLRMRLRCVVERAPVRDADGRMRQPALAHAFSDNCLSERARQPGASGRAPEEYHVLNDLVIDRGPAPYLSNLEVLCDDCPVTRVQADGLIVATPTGSTAYSMSSGGSMVHPSVPAILFTPICPHSLSFRPVLFPEHVTLQIKVPSDARASAWVSFDGRHRMELMRGDRVVVSVSRWWVPTFTSNDTTNDWFGSVSKCLRWNERVVQGGAGATDGDGSDIDTLLS